MFLPLVRKEKVGKKWFQLRVDMRLESSSLETHPLSVPFIHFLERVYRLGRETQPTHKT